MINVLTKYNTVINLQLKENTEGELGQATASFDHLGFSCHSAGCGTTLQIMNNDTTLAKVNSELRSCLKDF